MAAIVLSRGHQRLRRLSQPATPDGFGFVTWGCGGDADARTSARVRQFCACSFSRTLSRP